MGVQIGQGDYLTLTLQCCLFVPIDNISTYYYSQLRVCYRVGFVSGFLCLKS